MSDPRFIQLTTWLNNTFSMALSPVLISGDASVRRYFRVVVNDISYIVVDSPPEQLVLQQFIDIANIYAENDINVPEVIEKDTQNGFMLLNDLGDTSLFSILDSDNVEYYYKTALNLLNNITKVKATAKRELPLYDSAFIRQELEIFTDWLLKYHLSMTLNTARLNMLEAVFRHLIENANEQPQVGMHRDYHCRNIMLKNNTLNLIDFQDAVIGPITYDVVSLLRDCYLRWPDELVSQLMCEHYEQARLNGDISTDISLEQYRRWFDLMGLQRHIKAVGIFARLHHRDQKSAYLADIPLTLGYIRDVALSYPELKEFGSWVELELIPQFMNKAENVI
ncbi:phosphotransferase [Shewanella surugensis]|uniref:Phosphotransferase n=1 Tax=Shewanella surugensis TaxID=212020 RepID=A0ABT0LGR8_9GAMM|nr:phosphotransferase [Shewanella surugensis]MCL1126860.1 phosphotransferase [Shewanella surugensis]